MSKQTLHLYIEEFIKDRAKRIARKRGISVSQLFEELVTSEEDPEEWAPTPGSAAYELYHLIPDSKRMDNPDYDKLKYEALKEKYGIK